MLIENIRRQVNLEIDRYLAGKHDNEKKVIARECKQAVERSVTLETLRDALKASHKKLKELVARKNLSRLFKHRPGNLNMAIAKAVAQCIMEISIQGQPLLAKQTASELDWVRASVDKKLIINGTPFTGKESSLQQIELFLLSHGFTNKALREYVRDNANQASLWGMSILYTVAFSEVSGGAIPSQNTHSHRYTCKGNKLSCEDRANYNVIVSPTEGLINLKAPGLILVMKSAFIDESGTVQLDQLSFSLENTNCVTNKNLHAFALQAVNSISV
jgi:hypothetical protein